MRSLDITVAYGVGITLHLIQQRDDPLNDIQSEVSELLELMSRDS